MDQNGIWQYYRNVMIQRYVTNYRRCVYVCKTWTVHFNYSRFIVIIAKRYLLCNWCIKQFNVPYALKSNDFNKHIQHEQQGTFRYLYVCRYVHMYTVRSVAAELDTEFTQWNSRPTSQVNTTITFTLVVHYEMIC